MFIDYSKAIKLSVVDPIKNISIVVVDPSTGKYIKVFNDLLDTLTDNELIPNELGYDATKGLLYNKSSVAKSILVIAGDIMISLAGALTINRYTENQLVLPDDFGKCYQVVGPEGEFTMQELSNPAANGWLATAYDAVLEPAVITTLGPTYALIGNGSTEVNKSVLLTSTGDLGIVNLGPEESYLNIDSKHAQICLAPRKPCIAEAPTGISDTYILEGKFAVIVNGEVVPRYFNAEDLPKYFNGCNDWGIQFISEIDCVPTELHLPVLTLNETIPLIIGFSFDDGEIFGVRIPVENLDYNNLAFAILWNIFQTTNFKGTLFTDTGGSYNFSASNNVIRGGSGSALDRKIKLSLHRFIEDGCIDLYTPLFGETGQERIDIYSCGQSYFNGE